MNVGGELRASVGVKAIVLVLAADEKGSEGRVVCGDAELNSDKYGKVVLSVLSHSVNVMLDFPSGDSCSSDLHYCL